MSMRSPASSHGEYNIPGASHAELNMSPTSMRHHHDGENRSAGNPAMTPTLGGPAMELRFPFQKPEKIHVASQDTRGRIASDSRAGAEDDSDQELTGPQPSPPNQEEPLSPLRSHPPISPRGNWL